MKLSCFHLFLFTACSTVTYSFLLPWNRIVPSIRISEKNEVVVYWETVNPTSAAVVFFAPEDGTLRQPFPHYYFRAADKSVGNTHSVVLKDVETYMLYNYRVSCMDTAQSSELRSANYTFRVVKRGEKLELGLAITEGPIVANATANSVIVAWKTNVPCIGKLEYWTEQGNGIKSVISDYPQARFEVHVKGLSPDRVYQYRISVTSREEKEGTASSTYTFQTAPTAMRPRTFKFAAYGDSRAGQEPDVDHRLNGVNYLILNNLANAARNRGAHFFLQTGDLADGNTENREDMVLQYATHKKAIAKANAFIPFYQAMGNHDSRGPHVKYAKRGSYDPPSPNSAEDLWSETFVLPANGPEHEPNHPPFNENVYSFEYGNAHFICLNSQYFIVRQDDSLRYPYDGFANRVAGRQLEWLATDLRKAGTKLVFVYLHDPFYPTGGHIGSSLDRYPVERDSLWKLLEAHNVALVFAGHEHVYSRVKVDKTVNPEYKKRIFQITTGGAGAPTYAQDKKIPYLQNVVKFSRTYHYVLVTVDGERWKAEVFSDNDKKIDEFTP